LPAAFADRDVDPLLAALEAVGVPAEPVRLQNLNDFFDDEANHAAGLIAGYEHAAFGHFEQPGAYWNFGDLPVKLDRASPIIGQHTREILGELGYATEQIDALYDAGVVGGPTMPPGVV
jgi:crotonobetainyl-CoA:carnitine CoA-transferase CaiB-like acyl-CoA transferase